MTDSTPTNPVIRTTRLSTPGWVVREYADGMFDATNGRSLTIGVESFAAAVAEVRHMTRPARYVWEIGHTA